MSDHTVILKPELQALIEYAATLAPPRPAPSPATTTPEQWRALANNLNDAIKALELGAVHLEAAQSGSTGGKALRFETGAESARSRMYEAIDLHDRALVYARRAKPTEHLTLKDEAELAETRSRADTAAASAEEARTRAKAAAEDLRTKKAEAATAELTKLRTAFEAARAMSPGQPVLEPGAPAPALGGAADDGGLRAAREALKREVERQATLIKAPPGVVDSGDHWKNAKSRLVAAQSAVESARDKLGDPDDQSELVSSYTDQLDLLAEMILVLRRRLEQVARG